MFDIQTIRSEHKDVIHDVVYDYYGQRMATCSSDQTVKVMFCFDANKKNAHKTNNKIAQLLKIINYYYYL